MVEQKKDEKGPECALCAPFEQVGTWRCNECGAMNINKWKECWKCKSPRLEPLSPGL
ncbi:MAG TPA: hypothetical protein VMB46_08985 [Methanomassiliicoccales archaeon]|nr:hypothetical protein [Methanomassiliicoccales archaeon]